MPTSDPRWNAETEVRLIEMHRREHTAEEMARELGLPLDLIQQRLQSLLGDEDHPGEPWF